METRIREIFGRIPALADLRGVARLEAEEALRHTMLDVIDDYLADCEPVAVTGGAPEPSF